MRSKYGRGVGSSEVTKEARKVFGIGEKIPKDLEMEGKLSNGATIRILKAGIPKSYQSRCCRARLVVLCDCCNKWFSTGNINQHRACRDVPIFCFKE